jgi:Tol biopolymer transport system component
VTNQPGQSRQPWWSPDGGTLAISADRGTGEFEIVLVNSDGSDARSITSDASCAQPFWSPDGKMIAISAKIHEPRYRIFIMETDGSMLRPIRQPEAGDNVHPAWSPDGSRIVFTAQGLSPCTTWRSVGASTAGFFTESRRADPRSGP